MLALRGLLKFQGFATKLLAPTTARLVHISAALPHLAVPMCPSYLSSAHRVPGPGEVLEMQERAQQARSLPVWVWASAGTARNRRERLVGRCAEGQMSRRWDEECPQGWFRFKRFYLFSERRDGRKKEGNTDV